MNWKISVLLLVLVCACQKEKFKVETPNKDNYLIESSELKLVINNPNIKLLDFRTKEDYEKGHIFGAIHISRRDIEDKTYPYGGIMAGKLQMETLLGNFGINNNDTIIVYDDKGMCEAARFWWILQNYNFNNVKLLHGGIADWISHNGIVTTNIPEVTPTNFRLSENSEMKYYVSWNNVFEAIQNDVTIVDTRTATEFTGKHLKKGAKSSGRIPSSIHIDWADNINYHGNQRLKSIKELETIYNKLNIKKTDSIILYCHSGVRSAHTTFVLTQLLGYKNVMNYDGSWTEWSHLDDLPIDNDLHLSN